MFDTTKLDLKDILRDVHEGKLQLPDFQRDYVWGDEDVRSLIASIAKGFPVGALLTLETGGAVSFKPRLLEGVPSKEITPTELLLDGQQRITSLYQVTSSNSPVQTKNEKGQEIERYYYLDIKKAVNGEVPFEDSIEGLPADKVKRTNFGRDVVIDLNTPESEYEHDMFPLNKTYNFMDWYIGWKNYNHRQGRVYREFEDVFYEGILKTFQHYKMPIIKLDKNNSREAICLVFEKVNVGGKKLDAFELVTAIYASDEFDLRKDWYGSKKPRTTGRHTRMIGSPHKIDVLTPVSHTQFLQACTIIHTRENRLVKANEGLSGKELPQVTCSREALLQLPLDAYRKYADRIEAGFVDAGKFANELNIIWRNDLTYPPLLVALAPVFAILGSVAHTLPAKQKLAQWFWSVSLGELYGSGTDTKISKDVVELVRWIKDNERVPRSLEEAVFQADRLNTLRSRNSAAFKAIHALVMKHGCLDFVNGKKADQMSFFSDKIDIHHIFPISWCDKQGIDRGTYNSIINKTALSKETNIFVGGSAPSVYLQRIEKKKGLTPKQIDEILETHLINPSHLRNDDFKAFFEDRKKKLSDLIAKAMQKPVFEGAGSNEPVIDLNDNDVEDETAADDQ